MDRMVTYPVNLVEIVRQEYYAADNTRAVGNFHFDINVSKEEIECCLYSWGVSFFIDGECSTLRCTMDSPSSRIPELKSRVTDSEVCIEGIVRQTRIGRTCP